MAKQQVTGDKIILTLDQETREALSQKHRYDMALYQWAKTRWLTWKSEHLPKLPEKSVHKNTEEKILHICASYATTRKASYRTISSNLPENESNIDLFEHIQVNNEFDDRYVQSPST